MKPINHVLHNVLISKQSIKCIFVYPFNSSIGRRQEQGMRRLVSMFTLNFSSVTVIIRDTSASLFNCYNCL